MENYQAQLFPYAYNILGSAEEAKDAIQDVLLKYTQKGVVANHEKNYLIKGVVNQSINRKRDLKKLVQHEGWLPEPVTTEGAEVGAERRDMATYAMLHLLEKLNPKERAVFILKEAFAYTHDEVAEVLSITVEHSRKLLSRAHGKLHTSSRPKQLPQPPQLAIARQHKQLDAYIQAIQARDLNALHAMLANDIVFRADGGKRIKVVATHAQGAQAVAELLLYTYHTFQTQFTRQLGVVNHQPAILYYYKHQLKVCQVFQLNAITQQVMSVSTIVDPDKLKHIV